MHHEGIASLRRILLRSGVAMLSLFFLYEAPLKAELSVTLNAAESTVPTPRDGTVAPQPGVQLFVFEGSTIGQTYTAVFDVNEQPASVVLLAADMGTYAYDDGTKKLAINLTHIGYAEGIEPPGPPTDFGIALIGAVPLGSYGPPAQLAGSWMATNLGPLNWELLPPEIESPAFGYKFTGPEGKRGHFTMFIPQTAIEFLGQMTGQTITPADLAVFNNGAQASLSVSTVTAGETVLGALIELNVVFIAVSTELPPDTGALQTVNAAAAKAAAGTVAKKVTVKRELNLSLTASKLSVRRYARAKLYGWAKGAPVGSRVSLYTRSLGNYTRLWKRVTVGTNGKFSATFTPRITDYYKATFKPAGGSLKKSPVVKVTVIK